MVEPQSEYTDNIPVTNAQSQQLNFSIHFLHMNAQYSTKTKTNLIYVNK